MRDIKILAASREWSRRLVTVIGATWLFIGAVAAIFGTLALVALGSMPFALPPLEGPAMRWIWHHHRQVAFGPAVFGLLIIYVALSFFERRRWARPAMQMVSVVVLLVQGTSVAMALVSVWAPSPRDLLSSAPVRVIETIAIVGVFLVFAVPVALGAWSLTSAGARREYARRIT